MIFRLLDNKVVISAKGKNKILNFRFANTGMLPDIFNEIFVDKVYFKDFGKGRIFSINKKDTVIDIGANVGFFSVYAANLAYQGKVYAFEPVKSSFEQLLYYKNRFKLDNLIVQNNAVSNERKEAKIWLSAQNIGAHCFYKDKISDIEKEKAEDYEITGCITLKDAFDHHDIKLCDFLKIDVEGEEYNIIENMPREYFDRIQKIALEYHPVPGKSVWSLADYLNDLGFAIYIFHWNKNFGRLFAYKKQKCA